VQYLVERTFFSLICVCLSPGVLSADDVVSPSPALPVDQVQVQAALRPLVNIAIQGDKSAPEQIASQIKSLSGKTGNDPRLHYLHGLSLLKNFRHAEAMTAMQAGANHKIYYFPIHHFLIYEQIREKKYEAAIESLVELSARIGDPGQVWTSEVDRLDAARWLGRMVVFLSGPCGDQVAAKLISQAEPVMRSQMPEVYQGAMEEGATEVHADHRALQVQLLSKVNESAAKKAGLLKENEQKKLDLETRKKELSTYEREKAAVQQEQLKEIEGQLESLEKQYLQLQRTHDQIVAAIATLRVQIATTPASTFNGGTIRNPVALQRFNDAVQRAQEDGIARALKEAELQGYVIELNENIRKQTAVLKIAEASLLQRQQLLSQLKSENSRQQAAAQDFRRWERRLSMNQKKVATEGDRSAVAVRTRISLLSTYDSIQPQTELSQLAIGLNVDP
jgi:hypothetical protein